MKIKALFTGFNLVEGQIYDVIFEYDTVYQINTGQGIYCRNKEFFIIMKECCLNCHYYLSDDNNSCQGLKDIENDSCHEYKKTLYK